MPRIYYDTEFIDDGKTIELISIAMINEKGEAYYGINLDLSLDRLAGISWHMENTVPSLPIRLRSDGKLEWEDTHASFALVESRDKIRDDVLRFILKTVDKAVGSVVENIELWAWYSAYDHVALAQLWGPMVDLPKAIVPMYTNDLKQEMTRKEKLGNPRLRFNMPMHEGGSKAHNALDDARLLKKRAEWLEQF